MITEQDTFDTLKYGHIPMSEVLTYMKQIMGDDVLDEFDDQGDEHIFSQLIPFMYDTDSLDIHGNPYMKGCMIQMYILEPDEEWDRDTVEVCFCLDTTDDSIMVPEYMNKSIKVHKRSDLEFLQIEWQEFVGVCFLEILKNCKFYKTTFDVPLILSDISEDICYFKSRRIE